MTDFTNELIELIELTKSAKQLIDRVTTRAYAKVGLKLAEVAVETPACAHSVNLTIQNMLAITELIEEVDPENEYAKTLRGIYEDIKKSYDNRTTPDGSGDIDFRSIVTPSPNWEEKPS